MSRNIRIAPDATTDGMGLVDEDDEITLTMRPDEKKKLIESAFPEEERDATVMDDEITLDRPTPVAPPPSSSARVRALKVLTIKPPSPPTLVEMPPPSSSRWRPHVTPALAKAARELLAAQDKLRRSLALKRSTQIWLVAGIWAMALSLVVMLALLVTSA